MAPRHRPDSKPTITASLEDSSTAPSKKWNHAPLTLRASLVDLGRRLPKLDANHSTFISGRYIVNGKTVCSSYFPVITKKMLQDSPKDHLYLKWGIYDAWVSDWLVSQEKNKMYLIQPQFAQLRYLLKDKLCKYLYDPQSSYLFDPFMKQYYPEMYQLPFKSADDPRDLLNIKNDERHH